MNKPFKTNAIQKAVMASIQKKIISFYNQLCPYSGASMIEYKSKNVTVTEGNSQKTDALTDQTKVKLEKAEGKPRGLSKGQILVVDDYEQLLESLHQTFHYAGFDVVKTSDPEHALELAKTISPNILITDINMPKLDGITMAKRFKEIRPDTKVILMTAYHTKYENNIKEALAEGLAQHVIHKPFKSLKIQRAVDFLLLDKSELGKNGMQTSILFVDDEKEITDFLKEFFDERHYTTFVTNEAEKGLEVYNEAKPDIVVTDIKMPGRGSSPKFPVNSVS